MLELEQQPYDLEIFVLPCGFCNVKTGGPLVDTSSLKFAKFCKVNESKSGYNFS